MHARTVAWNVAMGLIVVVSTAWGVEATVTDSSGQTLVFNNVTFPDGNRQEPFLQLKLVSPGKDSDRDAVELNLAAASLKDIAIDPASKGKRDYRTRVVLTLIDGTQYRGEVGGQMQGENELGKGSIEFGKLNKAVFSRKAGDTDYTPQKSGSRGQFTDKDGHVFAVTAVSSGGSNDRSPDDLECELGEIKLSVPLENIAKIENIGEVKLQYGTGAKLRLTMASGRTLEVTGGSGGKLHGHFQHGRVEMPLGVLASATLEKKK